MLVEQSKDPARYCVHRLPASMQALDRFGWEVSSDNSGVISCIRLPPSFKLRREQSVVRV